MYSTTTLVKNSRFNGRYIGTHQRIDLAARHVLEEAITDDRCFPSGKEIIYFEGTRGPDGLKRKSPGEDEPSHMWSDSPDGRDVKKLIYDYRHNLVTALKACDREKAAREAAWMAHMVTDALTPAHHYPLGEEKKRLMTSDEMMTVFGAPMKGLMKGRNWRETWKNNWQYWGFSGGMAQHISYEYGALMLVASIPIKKLIPKVNIEKFRQSDFKEEFLHAVERMKSLQIYEDFVAKGWTVNLVHKTRDQLLPMIIEMVALGWYSALQESNSSEVKDRA